MPSLTSTEATSASASGLAPRLLNLDRAERVMRERQLDALIATAPENVTYASDYWALSQWLRRVVPVYVILPRGRPQDAALIVPTTNIDLLITNPTWIPDIRRYGSFIFEGLPEGEPGPDFPRENADLVPWLNVAADPDALSSLVRTVREKGLAEGRLGVDEGGIAFPLFEELRAQLPKAELTYATDTFSWIRMVKTENEIARVRDATRITERAIDVCLAEAKVGMSERDLAAAFECSLVRQGAEPANTAIGFGPRSASPNVQPTDYCLRAGEIIRLDVGCRYLHYRADIARCAVLGKPSDEIQRVYQAILVGEQAGIAALTPGAKSSDIYQAAIDATRAAGLPHYRRSHVGHGIGLEGYDPPNLSSDDQTVLEPGMVFCVETPYYDLTWGGLQVEDTVVVRSDNVQSLMLGSSELRVLE